MTRKQQQPPSEWLTAHEAARVALVLLRRALAEMTLIDGVEAATDGRRLFESQLGVIEDWVAMHGFTLQGGHS
jgi:hypothetical protein